MRMGLNLNRNESMVRDTKGTGSGDRFRGQEMGWDRTKGPETELEEEVRG